MSHEHDEADCVNCGDRRSSEAPHITAEREPERWQQRVLREQGMCATLVVEDEILKACILPLPCAVHGTPLQSPRTADATHVEVRESSMNSASTECTRSTSPSASSPSPLLSGSAGSGGSDRSADATPSEIPALDALRKAEAFYRDRFGEADETEADRVEIAAIAVLIGDVWREAQGQRRERATPVESDDLAYLRRLKKEVDHFLGCARQGYSSEDGKPLGWKIPFADAQRLLAAYYGGEGPTDSSREGGER